MAEIQSAADYAKKLEDGIVECDKLTIRNGGRIELFDSEGNRRMLLGTGARYKQAKLVLGTSHITDDMFEEHAAFHDNQMLATLAARPVTDFHALTLSLVGTQGKTLISTTTGVEPNSMGESQISLRAKPKQELGKYNQNYQINSLSEPQDN